MKAIIITGIVIFSLNILADVIIVLGKKLLDPGEFNNSRVIIIIDAFCLSFFIFSLTLL